MTERNELQRRKEGTTKKERRKEENKEGTTKKERKEIYKFKGRRKTGILNDRIS